MEDVEAQCGLEVTQYHLRGPAGTFPWPPLHPPLQLDITQDTRAVSAGGSAWPSLGILSPILPVDWKFCPLK